jgi:tripartite-type tricarboxylate transporter receptor subunit TctC
MRRVEMKYVMNAVVAASIALAAMASPAFAQNYPAKTVRMVVPFSAGSGSDTIGRMVAGALSEGFGQQVIVDNRAGAAGNIGAEIVAKAPADGYTLLFANIGHAANVTLYRNMAYDIQRDFATVTQVASAPAIVVVHPSLPVKSIAELVRLAKAKPGAINYASGGAGTATFIAAELFTGPAGIRLLHVPYRAGGEALTSVLSGETSVYFAPLATALPHVRQNRLRALAVTSTKRVALLPELPTVAELGYRGYQSGNWYGILVPAKTPREIIATLRNQTVTALAAPALNKRLVDLGYISIGDTPEEFAAHIKAEIASLAKVLRDLNVTAN